MIIHISGAIGSGKTTLGKELKSLKRVVVEDLDDLFNEFVKRTKKFSSKAYQKYIYNFIDKHSRKNIIFVGLNQDMGNSATIYDLRSEVDYFIDLDIEENVRRLFLRDYMENVSRFFFWHGYTPEMIFNEWKGDEKFHNQRLCNIIQELSPAGLRKRIKEFHHQYRKLGYTFVKPQNIKPQIMQLLAGNV